MTSESEETQAGSADPAAENTERDQISANIAAVLEFYAREELKVSRSQKVLERISMAVGQPYFLALILVFVALWVSANVLLGLTLLTEQKAAKLIDMLDELRRDMPDVTTRHDPAVASLQQAMNPGSVLAALDEKSHWGD